jgi:hypothetical protein
MSHQGKHPPLKILAQLQDTYWHAYTSAVSAQLHPSLVVDVWAVKTAGGTFHQSNHMGLLNFLGFEFHDSVELGTVQLASEFAWVPTCLFFDRRSEGFSESDLHCKPCPGDRSNVQADVMDASTLQQHHPWRRARNMSPAACSYMVKAHDKMSYRKLFDIPSVPENVAFCRL